MYRVYVRYNMKPGAREGFLEALAGMGLRKAVLAEEGCLGFDYYRAVDDPDVLMLVELWKDRAAQQLHLTLPHMQALPPVKEQYVLETKLEAYDI